MRSATLALTLITLIGSFSQATKTSWSWEADTRIRHEIHSNPAGTTGGSLATKNFNFTEQKTSLGLNFNQGEAFRGRMKLIHSFNWGADATTANSAAEFNTPAGSTPLAGQANGIGDEQNLLLVNEAWLWWKLGDSLSLRLGRGGINISDEKVISNNADEITPTSFDGAIFTYDHDIFDFQAMAFKLADGFNPAINATSGTFTNDPESTVFGGSLDFKGMPEALRDINIHVFQTNTDDGGATGITGNAQTSSLRYGLTLGGGVAGLSYKGTVALHKGDSTTSGATTDTSGTMFDLMARYDLPEIANLFLLLGFHQDSGDSNSADNENETYDSFFYNRHENAGLMDILAWGNLTYFYVGTGVTLADIQFALTYYSFSQTEENAATQFGTHGTFLNSGATLNQSGQDELGTEIDFTVKTALDNGMKVAFRWGLFSPGGEFVAPNDESYSQYVVEVGMDF